MIDYESRCHELASDVVDLRGRALKAETALELVKQAIQHGVDRERLLRLIRICEETLL